MVGQCRLADWMETDLPAPGKDGRQQVGALQGRKDQRCMGRRFLENFEQGIGGFRVHGMAVGENHHPLFCTMRFHCQQAEQLANLIDPQRIAPGGDLEDIGMAVPKDLTAGRAMPASVRCSGTLPVCHAIEGHGQGFGSCMLANAGDTGKQKGMREC
jgi:hypothetical protein